MKFRKYSRQWVVGLFFTGIAVLFVGCPGPGGEECGGIETVTSCVILSDVQPFDGATETSTPDVDVVQDLCPDLSVEPFTSHRADVTFNNTPFPEFVDLIGDEDGTEQDSLSVTIRQVRLEYQLDFCPVGAVCPPLTGFVQPVTINIPAEGSVTQRLDLVPLSVKNEFLNQGGGVFDFPLYNVEFTFTGSTDFFSNSIEITGNAPVILGNFDNCPEEEEG